MKYIVVSQPKSGTYLTANLLQNLGLQFTCMHINPTSYEQYDLDNLENSRRNPRNYTVRKSSEESTKLIGHNQFAVSHLDAISKHVKILKGFKKIVVYRDNLKESQQSWDRWLKESGRSGKLHIDHRIREWMQYDNTFEIRFEDMIGKNVSKIDDLQKFIHGEIIHDSLECIEQALQQDSLTKSSVRK